MWVALMLWAGSLGVLYLLMQVHLAKVAVGLDKGGAVTHSTVNPTIASSLRNHHAV
jgi:hypothetical protein